MLPGIIDKLLDFKNLSLLESYKAMKYIISGKANDCQIASFLTALKMKGETIEEISGFSKAMLEVATKYKLSHKVIVDTCGTGGDGKNTFNISTTAAFIAAGAGVIIAKHGNRGVSSLSGSADVLEELGIKISIEPGDVVNCIEKLGIGFIYARDAHKAMKNVAKARRDLGMQTVFNILGPITNPAMATGRVLGVFDRKLMEKMTYSLKELGINRALVVYGLETLDEISVSGDTLVSDLNAGEVKKYTINPKDFGFSLFPLKELTGGSPKENAEIILEILSGKEKGAKRIASILNASAAIIAGERAKNFPQAIRLAEESIDRGMALEKLNKLIEMTNKC
ncbi:MAG: anthranilate phosphoribosyltransferase [Candidatus Humimicrobiaceae bacterium]